MRQKSIIGPPGTRKTTFAIKLFERYVEEGKYVIYVGSTKATVEAARDLASVYINNVDEINIWKDIRTIASAVISIYNVDPNTIFENVVQTLIWEGKSKYVEDFFYENFKLKVNPKALILNLAPSISYWKGGEIYFHFLNYTINNNATLEIKEEDLKRDFQDFKKYLKLYNSKAFISFDTARHFFDKFNSLIEKGFQLGKYYVTTYYPKLYVDFLKDEKNVYDVVICDEDNENTYLQYLDVRNMGSEVIFFGDINQTIQSYGDILKAQIEKFKDSRKIYFLKKQYRMAPEIWNFAKNLLNKNRHKMIKIYGKKLTKKLIKNLNETEVVNKEGGSVIKIKVNSEEEALRWIEKFVREKKVDAVITRRRDKLIKIERSIKNTSVVLSEELERFAQIVREIMYLDGSYTLDDLRFIIDDPSYFSWKLLGIEKIDKDVIINKFGGLDRFLKIVTGKYWRSVKKAVTIENPTSVSRVMTIHRAKGKTFDSVVLFYDFRPGFMRKVRMFDDVYLYEIRNLYVGVTRPRRFIAVIYYYDEII